MNILEFLSKVPAGDVFPVIAVILGILAGVIISVTAIVSGQVRRFRERQLAMDLIHDLADRGMPSDEIERLVRASEVKDFKSLRDVIGHRRSCLTRAKAAADN
ncbi:MAG: hypothetical protein ABIP48_17865 [Planctomycetota bacterium]